MASGFLGLLLCLLYFLPTFIANFRGHPGANVILAMNVFLGWTVIFWFIALGSAMGTAVAPRNTLQNFVDRHFGPLTEDETK